MNDAIAVFEPMMTEDSQYMWGGLICAILAFSGMLYVFWRKFEYHEQNKKWLLAMLLFFVFLIASGTTVFSFLSYQRLDQVAVYQDYLKIGNRQIPFEQIKQVKLEKSQQKSMVNPNIVTNSIQLLIIEELSGKVSVLSEKNYKVNDIMNTLNATIKEK